MATPRQLSDEHPVFMLLRPHTRFTLQTNKAAYKYFTNRKKTYFEFYAGTLEETRQIAIDSYVRTSFHQLELSRELRSRDVDVLPERYPYRDDARLWIPPIRDFVTAYIDAFYPDDQAVQEDFELQEWAAELMDPARGAIRELVPDDTLDTKAKLIALLAQVLFTAGPGHASQHYSSSYFYRYAPACPAAAYVPPPWKLGRVHEARFRNMLPPIGPASNQARYNTFGNLLYDRFGDYRRYALSRLPQAQQPITQLRAALARVECEIEGRLQDRMLPYNFLLPSRVPNSTNI
jgi:arachidonate 15-lipoxygenase